MRLLKALSFALAIVGFALFAISCGSGGAQYRVVDTIAGLAFNLDIDVNVATPTTTTVTFANVTLGSVEPSSTSYQKISTGSDPIEVFQTGTTTPVINSTPLNLGSNPYTVLLLGVGSQVSAPEAMVLTDNNTVPPSGNGEFRIVNGAPNSPGGSVDTYILPQGTAFPNSALKPDVTGLLYGQPSSYVSKTAVSSGTAYQLYVCAHGQQIPFINGQAYTLSTGQIFTIVLIDNPSQGFPGTPILLTDLQ